MTAHGHLAARTWLIAYDIAHPGRLARVHRLILRHTVPIQHSVFYFEGSITGMDRLMSDIATRIDPDEDDVRAYALPEPLHIDTLGRSTLPLGTLMLSSVSTSLQTLLQQDTQTML